MGYSLILNDSFDMLVEITVASTNDWSVSPCHYDVLPHELYSADLVPIDVNSA